MSLYDFFNRPKLKPSTVVDIIEKNIKVSLKPLGFRCFGRTLHRFLDTDISQVISFQIVKNILFVNVGIRVPECEERSFEPCIDRMYYHEYECNIRSRLGIVSGGQEEKFDLRKSPDKTADRILKEIIEYVIPAFEVLNNRQNILEHRREYPQFDVIGNGCILLDEAMIYGKLGNVKKAKDLFSRYYGKCMAEYEDSEKNGTRIYLKKGERVVFKNQDITSDRNGYVTVYGGSRGHLDYLDNISKTLFSGVLQK